MGAHIHEGSKVDVDTVITESKNFSVHQAKVYNPNTRVLERGYAILRKADKVKQGETTSYATTLQAVIQCENAITMFEAFNAQEQAHVDTEGLLTSGNPGPDDFIN